MDRDCGCEESNRYLWYCIWFRQWGKQSGRMIFGMILYWPVQTGKDWWRESIPYPVLAVTASCRSYQARRCLNLLNNCFFLFLNSCSTHISNCLTHYVEWCYLPCAMLLNKVDNCDLFLLFLFVSFLLFSLDSQIWVSFKESCFLYGFESLPFLKIIAELFFNKFSNFDQITTRL